MAVSISRIGRAAVGRPVVRLLLVGLPLVLSVTVPALAQQSPGYLTDVRPILANHCFACHGADAGSRQGELRLDLPPDQNPPGSAAARAIVPGRPEDSELLTRITSPDPELRMPPPGSGHELSERQVELLQQWIAGGAPWEAHWSFVRPQRPAVPELADDTWSRTPVDRFIQQALRERRLSGQPDADPYALIRRVSLDLTGLPPTVAEAEAFAADPSFASYEAVVERLLQSPQFGEHWARMWLDLARYADTKGYEKDLGREIWRYRDWVIQALNADLPFDQFTIQQLAGDLLPNATTDQILATAFHRNTMTNDEGGTDDEEFRMAAVKDRVDTTVQVWMGLTMGCARCHSHKYDPISQSEYYQFLAYFNQTEDADRFDDAPRIPTPTPEQQQRQQELEQQTADVRAQLSVRSPEFTAGQRLWEHSQAAQAGWSALTPVAASSAQGTTLRIQPDQCVLAQGDPAGTDVYSITCRTALPGHITALRLEALTHPTLPGKGPGRARTDANFVLSELTLRVTDAAGTELRRLPLQSARADFSQENWAVEKAVDGQPDTGWAISPQQGQPHVAVFELAESVQLQDGQLLQVELSQQYQPSSLLLGRVRLSVSSQPPQSLQPELQSVAEVAAIPVEQRTQQQEQQLVDAWLRVAPETAPLWARLQDLEKQLETLQAEIPRTPIMKDRPADRRRETHVHVRGNFLEPGAVVTAALPAAFSAASGEGTHAGSTGTRLDVAYWLMSEENPLTSRVMVNRIWARLFGRGLVETEEDFGMQGSLPTHPELLDWLAVEFRETQHWSLKKLCRLLVLSSVYRQSSVAPAVTLEADPDNRWLSRGPRFRLTAEAVRDQALAASGLLSTRIGGPSVMPPQPDGIWRTTYSKLRWETPTDENRYRRGIYTFLRRTSPYPSMITFDAGSREVCMIRRIQTNTPLQALVTMNDPVYIEAAGALAQRAAAVDGGTAQQLQAMFRHVLIRPPVPAELSRLQQLWQDTAAEFRARPQAAAELLESARVVSEASTDPAAAAAASPAGQAEAAAHVVVASVLLNLDETLMRP